ncbi:MAG: hypothetical protein BGO01_03870 [Armatimonadetes bacterium 55-13]|nr:MarR family transcriptional regulator [Armatimonadota bacterium]OJU63288.1 MAG: hypothetical protein BGO01_03870 [Armatimonadetes bacterium 55-13]
MNASLSEVEKKAWVSYLLSSARITRDVDRRLHEAGVVDLTIYDILLRLEEAPDRRMKMTDLADASVFSKSGITRLVDRLEKDGLIERQSCPADRRRVHAWLTEKGLEERKRAWPVYRAAIYELFTTQMAESELASLGDILEKLI